MRNIEYRLWEPIESPLSVEFPAELLLDLGWAENSGRMYGAKCGRAVRVASLNAPTDEQQEKIGVFGNYPITTSSMVNSI
jgi:hypothetical protein